MSETECVPPSCQNIQSTADVYALVDALDEVQPDDKVQPVFYISWWSVGARQCLTGASCPDPLAITVQT